MDGVIDPLAAPSAMACPGCGVVLPSKAGAAHPHIGASPACWEVYGEVLAREYGDPNLMAFHRYTVDAYAAQHPGAPGRRSIQSVWVHLAGLHLLLRRRSTPVFARRVIAALTEQAAAFEWLTPPPTLGAITVANVAPASRPEEHAVAVRAWAESVWDAWQPHHDVIAAVADRAAAML